MTTDHDQHDQAPDAPDASPVAPGARLEKLAGDFKFTEGPAPDAEGNVYFTDQPNDRILKWSTDGKLSTFMSPCGRSNGLAFDKAGNLYVATGDHGEIHKVTPQGQGSVFFKTEEEHARAMAVDASGNVYVADWGNDRIQKFSTEGRFLTKFGSPGSGDRFAHRRLPRRQASGPTAAPRRQRTDRTETLDRAARRPRDERQSCDV